MFYTNGKWSLFIKEFNHTIDIVRAVDNQFNEYPHDLKHLISKSKNKAADARKKFLGNFKNLDEFLQFHPARKGCQSKWGLKKTIQLNLKKMSIQMEKEIIQK